MNTEIKFYKIDNSDIEPFILNRKDGEYLNITGIKNSNSSLMISTIFNNFKEPSYLRNSLIGIEIQVGSERGYYTGYVSKIVNIKGIESFEHNVYEFNVMEKHETCAWLWDLIPNYTTESLVVSF